MNSKILYFESATHSTETLNSLCFKAAIFFFFAFFGIPSNVSAQNPNLLYGVTAYGGNDGIGVIFHIDKNTAEQTVDYSFPIQIHGNTPYGNLTYGGNGKFYGMTSIGGVYNYGIIFEWDSATNVITKKIDFDNLNGVTPRGSLTNFNGKFYGMTTDGGTYGSGVIFEWDPVTNIYIKKFNFDHTNSGSHPYGSLTLNEGKFYGMTSTGGANSQGVIFEWDPASNIFTKKIDWLNLSMGANPKGSLTFYNGKFYGMTETGGSYQFGVIFEWDPSTNTYVKKMDFDWSNGATPKGSLALKDGKLYGMTAGGGNYFLGVIFEWDPLNNVIVKKIDFDGTFKGSSPYGELTYDDGVFYGLSSHGGINNFGVIFKWDPSNNNFSKQVDFDVTSKGAVPYGSLLAHNGKFYGLTTYGGEVNSGVLFEWDKVSNIFTKKIDFNKSINGGLIPGSLTIANGKFYGMTCQGGTYGKGVIFEWNPEASSFSNRFNFNGTDQGAGPQGTLTYFGGKFYGMTSAGGVFNKGVIFEWDPFTNIFEKKIDLDSINGSTPIAALVSCNGLFYGMTNRGGSTDGGVIFEWNPVTNIINKKIDFNGANGRNPYGQLLIFNGKFYGLTLAGGDYYEGTLFEWEPATNTLTNKVVFHQTYQNKMGKQPYGSLAMHNGKFYGMTVLGGTDGGGVIFEWDPSSNVYTKKINFNSVTGFQPMGTLTMSNGKFYGMTKNGTTVNGKGVIFEWDPSIANTYNKIFEFTTFNGGTPFYTHLAIYNDSTTAAQATNIYFNDVQNTQLNINWADGSGEKRAVFIKQGSDGTALPLNNFTYVADTVFGSGTQIGSTGWFCVFNGTEHNTGVTVTNLQANTAYRVMVCEYTGTPGFEQYNDSTAEGNPANQTAGYFYTITTSSIPTNGGTTIGGGSYISGSQATVTATPNTGYSFVNWTENSTVVSTSASYTFTVSGARSLVANFALQQFSISTSANPAVGGSASGGGIFTYGTQATVTATPSANWTFLNWTENGNPVSTSASYSFTVTANRALVANFTQVPTFLVTTASNPIAGGLTSGGGNYISGQTATVTATANTGYDFINWTENGNPVSTTSSYSFTVTSARNLVANFVLQQFSITTASDPPSGGTTSGDGTFAYGNLATVTATANSNFTFSYWSENGAIVATTPQYSFTVTASRLLVANFEPDPTYLISTYSAPVFGGTTTGGGSFLLGQTATVSATPGTGYYFTNWTENGNVVSTEVTYSFTVTGARTLTANFVLQQYTVTTSPNPPAGGATSGGGTYNYGAQVTLNATANSNWTFLNWTENGSVVSTLPEYVFIVNTNQSFVANFTQSPTYLVTTSSFPVDGGTTSGGGNYIAGQVATVSAVSNTGYSFANWTENGNVVSTDSVFSFAVTANTNLVANFDPADFLISAVAIPAGSGTISGGGIYPYGSTAMLTASSGKSWQFYEWTENCKPVSANASYSFVVTSSRDLAAVFYQPGVQFVTTTIPQPIEGGYVTGCGTYYVDSVATVNAIPYSGWEFVNWTENGVSVSSGSEYSYQVLDHRILTANFRLYTGIIETQQALIRVFPNPTEDKLFIECESETTQKFDEVYLYNSLSQLVYQQHSKGVTSRLTIDVKSFAPGVYYLVVKLKGAKVDDFRVVVKH